MATQVEDPLKYMRALYRVNSKRAADRKLSGDTRMKIVSSLQVVKHILDSLEAGKSPGEAVLAARLRFSSPNHIRTMATIEGYIGESWERPPKPQK